MRRPSSSFLIASSVSLTLHATVLFVLPRLAGDGTFVRSDADPDSTAIAAVVEDAMLMRMPEPLVIPAVPPPEDFVLGDASGKGYASHDLDDPAEATAREADADQAFLSLDPPGVGDTGQDPTVAPSEEADAGRQAARDAGGGTPAPPTESPKRSPLVMSPAAIGVASELQLPRVMRRPKPPEIVASPPEEAKPKVADDDRPVAMETTAAEEVHAHTPIPEHRAEVSLPAPPEPSVNLDPTSPAAPTGERSPVRTAGDAPAGDPARMSDSESDPFSRLGTVVFRDGGMDIRFGRKVKTRRPRILLAGQLDLLTLRQTSVLLRIDIDATGKVTGVEVVKSSGSNQIDQPTRVAVYDWWFEPRKDAAGLAVSDQIQFTIGWR